jgi:hypothetical protein
MWGALPVAASYYTTSFHATTKATEEYSILILMVIPNLKEIKLQKFVFNLLRN